MFIASTNRIFTFLLILGFCLLGPGTTASAAHPGPPFLSAEQARIIAMTFRIADGETKTVVFRSAQRRSYQRPMRVE